MTMLAVTATRAGRVRERLDPAVPGRARLNVDAARAGAPLLATAD